MRARDAESVVHRSESGSESARARSAPPQEENLAKEAIFAGGGELGERMRAIDWSGTPLGPVSYWPQSL